MATMTASLGEPAEADVVAFLEHDAFGAVTRIDTQAAHVFLTGDRAWKVKRPVELGFLDFSTAAKRRDALENELRLNRRTAPDLYVAVHPITRDAAGRLGIDGPGAPEDWVLEMRRFPDEALLETLAEHNRIGLPLLMALADGIALFHENAEIAWEATPDVDLKAIIDANAKRFAANADIIDEESSDRITRLHLDRLRHLAPRLEVRASRGRVRHVHGDLHLGNIAVIGGAPTLFDCIEFSRKMATIDVAYDLAFLLMDLWHRGLHLEANIIFNRYVDISPEDEDCALLMPFFMSLRASIRAHVLATLAASGDKKAASRAHDYMRLAIQLCDPTEGRLVAVGGLSGTGKTTLARALAGEIGGPPGARVLRSDVLRKRAASLRPETPMPQTSYTRETSSRTYRDLRSAAKRYLLDNRPVLLDAAFIERSQRDDAADLAIECGVPFQGLWLEADLETRVQRVEGRHNDASDADASVVRAQKDAGLDAGEPWHIVNVDGKPDEATATARAILSSGNPPLAAGEPTSTSIADDPRKAR